MNSCSRASPRLGLTKGIGTQRLDVHDGAERAEAVAQVIRRDLRREAADVKARRKCVTHRRYAEGRAGRVEMNDGEQDVTLKLLRRSSTSGQRKCRNIRDHVTVVID